MGVTSATERQRIDGSDAFGWLVRAGFTARALTYGITGGLALALALGAGTDHTATDQQGALSLISRAPLGRVALIAIAAGLLAYAIWKLYQGIRGYGPEGGGSAGAGHRIAAVGGGIGYLLLFVVAVRILTGNSKGSGGSPAGAAAGVLGWPGGRLLVGAAGVTLIAIALYQAYYGWAAKFAGQSKTGEMSREQRRVFIHVGRIGLIARALVFGIIGYFVLKTAVEFKAHSAVGVDGALARLHHEPLGPWLVGLVAVGLMTFAAFSLFEARFRRL